MYFVAQENCVCALFRYINKNYFHQLTWEWGHIAMLCQRIYWFIHFLWAWAKSFLNIVVHWVQLMWKIFSTGENKNMYIWCLTEICTIITKNHCVNRTCSLVAWMWDEEINNMNNTELNTVLTQNTEPSDQQCLFFLVDGTFITIFCMEK